MNTTQTLPGGRFRSIGERLALALLHSPLRFLLEPGIAEISYSGVRSGRDIRLPVLYAREGDQVAIYAAGGHNKTWWRNFRGPRPLRIRIGDETCSGIALVTGPGTPEFHAALKLYRRRFPRMHYRPGDQLLAVTLHNYH